SFFKNHLDSCPACAARLQEIAEIEGEVVAARPSNIFSMSPNLFRYAIAAILVIAVGVAVVVVMQNQQQEQITSQQCPSEQNIAEVSLDPERFVPNQVLENFVERTVRSSSGITLIAPTTGDTVAFPFAFKWKGNDLGKNVVVTVVDNTNSDVWSETSSSSELTSEKKLAPGLYYIKLSTDQKLVQVGKFVVVK
ncbi:MAG: hypothetical protein HYV29_05525, partial [Ignavibacteriales bacterium]|nr:hypothetical protein [Ignavibacteriales bacterium]